MKTKNSKPYLKALFAIAFQGFLIMICVAIYAVLLQGITNADNIHKALWGCASYTVLLCLTLFKTGSLAKSLFSAHSRKKVILLSFMDELYEKMSGEYDRFIDDLLGNHTVILHRNRLKCKHHEKRVKSANNGCSSS